MYMHDMYNEKSMNMNSKDVCRLCGSENGILINIFNPDCLAKIESVIPDLIILRNDCLSKMVCHRCVAKVKDFYEFKETCIHTQNVLKGSLPWMSSNIKNGKCVPPLRPVSPVIKFLGGPMAHPYGDPEPEVEVLTLSDDEDPLCPGSSSQTHLNLPSSSRQTSPIVEGPPSKKPCQSTNGPSPVIRNTLKSAFHPDRGMQAGASATTVPPQHPFRTFLEFQHQIESMTRQPLSHSQSASAKNFHGKRNSQTGRASFPTARRKQSLDISSTSDSPVNSALQEVSTNHMNSGALPHTVPSVVPISNNKSLSQSGNKTVTLGKSSPSDSNGPINSTLTQVADKPAVNSTVKSVKDGKKGTGAKPMPKCKKKVQKDLTEADVTRICQTYPKLHPLKICENTIILTCSGCSTILTKEDAVLKHKCCVENSVEKAVDHVELKKDDSQLLLNQNEESNHSTSSSVELICSDDEISNCKLDPQHKCNICGKQFLNLARLQKHELSHISTEASC